MENFIGLLVVGTSIWVAVDASRLGARRGVLGGGFVDMGAFGWFFCCLLLWIVAFPVYLGMRPKYRRLHEFIPEAGNGYYDASAQVRFGVPDNSPYGYGADRFAPYVDPSVDSPTSPTGSEIGTRADKVIRLAALRDSGALTQAEFDLMKRELVGDA